MRNRFRRFPIQVLPTGFHRIRRSPAVSVFGGLLAGPAYLSSHMEVPTQEIAPIGHQRNDVPMFKRSGLSIGMGNAPDDVKKPADTTTDSYTDEGFAKAMERFILGAPD